MILDNFWNKIERKKGIFLMVFFIVFTLSYLLLTALDFLPEKPSEKDEKKDKEVAELRGVVSSGYNNVSDEENGSTNLHQTNNTKILKSNNNTDNIVNTNNTHKADESNYKNIEIEGEKTKKSDSMTESNFLPTSIHIKKLNRRLDVNNPVSGNIDSLNQSLLTGVVRHPDSANLNQKGSVLIFGHSSYLPKVINKNFQAFNGIQNLAWGDLIEVNSDNLTYLYKVDKVYETKSTDTNIPIAGTKNKLVLATCNTFGEKEDRFIVEASRVKIKNSVDKS